MKERKQESRFYQVSLLSLHFVFYYVLHGFCLENCRNTYNLEYKKKSEWN